MSAAAEPHESWEELLLAGPSTLQGACPPPPYPCRAFVDLLEQSSFGQCRASDAPHASKHLRHLRVLSLHFADLLTLMRSVATAGRLGYTRVKWYINCESTELMARHLLLLSVARTADGPDDWRFFWNVFFNKYILTEQKLRLKALLNGLAEGGANGGRADDLLRGIEAPPGVLARLRGVWKAWLGGLKSRSSSVPSWGSQAELVHKFVRSRGRPLRDAVEWPNAAACAPACGSACRLRWRRQVSEAAYRYLATPKLLDPQVTYDSAAFDVWSNPAVAAFWPAVERRSLLPFDQFAPFTELCCASATGGKMRSVLELCYDRAAGLVSEFAAACRFGTPELTVRVLGLGNDLLAVGRLCGAAEPKRFHLVDAGTLADACPLADILVACQPLLLGAQSLLLTATSRWLLHHPSAPAYLDSAVGRLPYLLFGLRLHRPTESDVLPAARASGRPCLLLRWAPDADKLARCGSPPLHLLDPLLPHCIGPPAFGRLAYGCYAVAEARLGPRSLYRLLSYHGLEYFELDLMSRLPALARALLSTRQGQQFDPHYLHFSTVSRPQPLACLTLDLRRPGTLTNVDDLCVPGSQLVALVFESRADVATFAGAYEEWATTATTTAKVVDPADGEDPCARLQRRLAGRVRAFERPFHALPLVPLPGGVGGGGVARVFLPAITAEQFGPYACLVMEAGRCVLARTRNNRVLLWSSLVAGRLADFRPAELGQRRWPGARLRTQFMELPLQIPARLQEAAALMGIRLGVTRPPGSAAAQLSRLLGPDAYPKEVARAAAAANAGEPAELDAPGHWAGFVAQLLALRWAGVTGAFLRDTSVPATVCGDFGVGIRLRLLEPGCRGSRPVLLAERVHQLPQPQHWVTVRCPVALMSEVDAALDQSRVCPGVSCLTLPLRLPRWRRRAAQLERLERMQDRVGRMDCLPCQV